MQTPRGTRADRGGFRGAFIALSTYSTFGLQTQHPSNLSRPRINSKKPGLWHLSDKEDKNYSVLVYVCGHVSAR